MRSPMPRAALLLLTALTLAAPPAAADVFTRLDPVAARVFTRTRAASPDAAGLMGAAEPTATLMSVDEDAMAAFAPRAAGARPSRPRRRRQELEPALHAAPKGVA
jgi:hypothetical protein